MTHFRTSLFLALTLIALAVGENPVRVVLLEPPAGRGGAGPVPGTSNESVLRLGQGIELLVRVDAPAGYRIGELEMAQTSEDFVLLATPAPARSDGTEASDGEGPALDIPIRIVPFQIGEISFPGVRVRWQAPDGTTGEATSDRWPVTVSPTVDNMEEATPADIRGPVDLPIPLPIRILLVAAAVLLAVAVAAWLLWRRRAAPSVRVLAPPPDPFEGLDPASWALRALQRLLAEGVLSVQGVATFHVGLAGIVRQYLTGRYHVETSERTTAEILQLVETGARPLPVVRQHLTDVLSQCDLVKFARFDPGEQESVTLVDTARRFVEETRPVSVPAAMPPATKAL